MGKMIVVGLCVLSTLMLTEAVTPLTVQELQHIQDFTAKAHMKRLQSYPDQIMTPSTHYLGRRLPAVENPPFYMQVPGQLNNAGVKPTSFEPQQAGAVQNYLVNYSPIASNSINQQPSQQQVFPQNGPVQYLQVQNANGGPPRGPPPPQFSKRPSFFSHPESSPPTSLLEFFFPKRHFRRPSFRSPIRFEYSQAPPQFQHQPHLHNAINQQNYLIQQSQRQQNFAQPSIAPATAQASTIKSTLGSQSNPTAIPSPTPTVVASASPNLITSHTPNFLNHNQFHRETPFYGKPIGKPHPPQKYSPVNYPIVTQNRPGDSEDFISQFLGNNDYSFLNFGPPHVPPVVAGPTSNRFANNPVSFTHIEQMQFPLQPQPLPMSMVVQSQEFPHYHFTTSFTASNQDKPVTTKEIVHEQHVIPSVIPHVVHEQSTVKSHDGGVASVQSASIQSASIRQTHRVKKLKRPSTTTTTTTSTPPSTTSPSLGELIFESAKETREFHDSARLEAPLSSNHNHNHHHVFKQRQPKPKQEHKTSPSPQPSTESSVVLAPLVFAQESSEPLTPSTSTSSPVPLSSTSVSVSTVSSTTQEPYFKAKITKSKGAEYHHKSRVAHEKRVTASGSGLSAVTVEPLRVTSTGSASSSTSSSSSSSRKSTTSPGRVITTSVTSRVVSTGAQPQNPQKRYRLRKVKVPNPDAKTNKASSTTTSIPTTTPSSTTTSVSSSTENSFTVLS